MTEPRDLTLCRAAALLRRGTLSAEALVQSCLERIAAREPQVRAWAVLQSDAALARAQQLDRKARRGGWAGPLHGIPLGVKDIIDVGGLETRAGTPAYPPRLAARDAPAVERLRRAGAIVLGKTETTAFAYADPAPTRNPWRLERTPGGSSAGSAAAVADRMCLAALGTQTAGSVLRPAAYNGIVGFKPSHGAIPLEGVIPLSWQLDHLGLLTRDVADANLLWQLLRDGAGSGAPRPLARKRPRRLWRVRGLFEEQAGPEALAALEAACRKLARLGTKIVELELPPAFAGVLEAHQTIMTAEAAAYHLAAWPERVPRYPPRIAEAIAEGRAVTAGAYIAALRQRARLIAELEPLLRQVDAVIGPTVNGPAPTPETTGVRNFQAPWSFCGIPALTLPCGLSRDGLPLGLQLATLRGGEDALLRVAGACEAALGFAARPE